jgi:hypothetical protein
LSGMSDLLLVLSFWPSQAQHVLLGCSDLIQNTLQQDVSLDG